MDDENGDENDDHEEDEATTTTTTTLSSNMKMLSKSWSVQTSHVPLYTGGKITTATTTTTTSTSTITGGRTDDTQEEGDDNNDIDKTNIVPSLSSSSFALLPVGGDVNVVDDLMNRGVRITSVRGKMGDSDIGGMITNDNDIEYDDEYDDEGFDREAITAYALSHDNNRTIITCSRDLLLRQYSIITESTNTPTPTQLRVKLVKTGGCQSGHALPVTYMEFHLSNVFLASGSVDGTCRVFDVRRKSFVTHVFRPQDDGGNRDTAGVGGSARKSVTALEWLPNVQKLVVAIGRDDGSITIHNLSQSSDATAAVTVLREHVSAVTCLKWNFNNNNIFVSAGRDAVLCLWKVTTETTKTKKKSKRKRKQQQGTEETDGVPVVVQYERMHTLPIYEQIEGVVLLNNNSPVTNSSGGGGGHHDNNNELLLRIVTAGSKGTVRLWGVVNDNNNEGKLRIRGPLLEQPSLEAFGEARGGYMGLTTTTATLHNNHKQQQQLIVADAEHNISFLDCNTLRTNRTLVGHNDDILDLKIIPPNNSSTSSSSSSSNSTKIVVATNSSKVRIFDLRDFSCQVLHGHTATVLCVDVSPCGRYIVTCGKDKQARLWRRRRTDNDSKIKCIAVAEGHTEAVGAACLSRKLSKYDVPGKASQNGAGAFIVTASIDRTLKRWNLPGDDSDDTSTTEQEEEGDGDAATPPPSLHAFVSVRSHEKDINVVSVAPNDSLVATGSQDKTIKLWKSADLTLKATLKGHRRGVWDCQFSPFDRVLASSSGDRTIKLWSLSDYSCLRTFQGHLSSVLRVRFLTGGLQLVSSGADGLVKLWTIRNNECEATMDGHNDKVWALDLSSSPSGDGSEVVMVSGGADSRLVVWQDTTQQVLDAKQAEEEEAILLDQKLANHLRHKEYTAALDISLKRDKPLQALKVLASLMEGGLAEGGGSGLNKLQQLAKTWSTERVLQILRYCREWNTRARNSQVAMAVCKAIFTTYPAHKLASIDGLPEILAGIFPYSERHFDRFDRLYTNSYLLDFALSSMGSLEEETADDGNDFAEWESKSRLVLPPKNVDGRIQVGGSTIVGSTTAVSASELLLDNSDDDEVMTVGESSDSSDDEL